jgi:hypothetical protein
MHPGVKDAENGIVEGRGVGVGEEDCVAGCGVEDVVREDRRPRVFIGTDIFGMWCVMVWVDRS